MLPIFRAGAFAGEVVQTLFPRLLTADRDMCFLSHRDDRAPILHFCQDCRAQHFDAEMQHMPSTSISKDCESLVFGCSCPCSLPSFLDCHQAVINQEVYQAGFRYQHAVGDNITAQLRSCGRHHVAILRHGKPWRPLNMTQNAGNIERSRTSMRCALHYMQQQRAPSTTLRRGSPLAHRRRCSKALSAGMGLARLKWEQM